jgi:hypothetical protein
MNTRLPVVLVYASTADISLSSLNACALGTMRRRSCWLGACSDKARDTPGRSRASAGSLWMTPTVDIGVFVMLANGLFFNS